MLIEKRFNKNYKNFEYSYATRENIEGQDGIKISDQLTLSPSGGELRNGNIMYVGKDMIKNIVIPTLRSGLPDASLLIIDRNNEAYNLTSRMLEQTYEYDVKRVSLVNPLSGCKYNPLCFADSDEDFKSIAKCIISTIPDKLNEQEKIYLISILTSFMDFTKRHGKEFYVDPTLVGVARLIEVRLSENGKKIIDGYMNALMTEGWYTTQKGEVFIGKPDDNQDYIHDKYSCVGDEGSTRFYRQANDADITDQRKIELLTALSEKMIALTGGDYSTLLSADDINISKMWMQKTAIYFELPEEDDEVSSVIASIIISQMFDGGITRKYRGKELAHIHIFADDLSTYAKIPKLISKMKSTDKTYITYVLGCESLSGLCEKYGEKKMEDLIEEPCCLIYGGCCDLDTAEYYSDRSGETDPLFPWQRPKKLATASDLMEMPEGQMLVFIEDEEVPYLEDRIRERGI